MRLQAGKAPHPDRPDDNTSARAEQWCNAPRKISLVRGLRMHRARQNQRYVPERRGEVRIPEEGSREFPWLAYSLNRARLEESCAFLRSRGKHRYLSCRICGSAGVKNPLAAFLLHASRVPWRYSLHPSASGTFIDGNSSDQPSYGSRNCRYDQHFTATYGKRAV